MKKKKKKRVVMAFMYLFMMLFISETLKTVLKRVSLKMISSYTMQQHNECE